jgi:hypothetical protein
MAIVPVPDGNAPGVYTSRLSLATLCDIGPSREGKVGGGRVSVTIKPVDAVGDPITMDAGGMPLHLLWEFAVPTIGLGRRRKNLPRWQPDDVRPIDPILVETDPGLFWVGSDAALYLVGGTPGDKYQVTATQWTPYDFPEDAAIDVYEPPFDFRLTAIFDVPVTEDHPDGFVDLPYVPDYAWGLVVATGQAQVVLFPSGATVPLNPREKPYPLSLGRIQVSTGVYQFAGGM